MSVESESAHALTGAYVLDALEPQELATFERHLAACSYCREEVSSFRAAVVRLPAVSAVAPPPELRASVLSAITGVRPLPPLPEQEPLRTELGSAPAAATQPVEGEAPLDLGAARERRDRRVNRWRLVAAAAVVVGIAGVGWGLGGGPAPELAREAATIQRPGEVQLSALLAAGDLEVYVAAAGSGMNGTVLRSESVGAAAALLQDLPPLVAGQVFQAWTISGVSPVSAGVFNPSDGVTTVLLEGDVLAADVFAVTIEPEGGSETPTGDILLQVGLSA